MKEWKGRWKKGLSVFLTMAVICSGVNVPAIPAFAEESVGKEQEEELAVTVPVAEDELPDSEELFAGYVEKVFYEGLNDGISTYGNLGEQRLQGEYNQKLYAVVKENVKAIADGKEKNTKFIISLKDIGLENIVGATLEEADANFVKKIDAIHMLDYLIMDCPYDLYWCDKTNNTYITYRLTSDGQTVIIPEIVFSFAVAEEYKAGEDCYTITGDIAVVHEAVANAREIVEKYKSLSDYEKLVNYRKEICNRVSYNDKAIEDINTPYGNPWQLIWVFDNDATTNVVCEGYAKAFQYLCDISEFTNVTCYTVIGTMSGGTGAGPHMWNLVAIDGKNYLADITNCDKGTIGAEDLLFLTGATGSVDEGYTVYCWGEPIFYVYDSTLEGLFGSEILTLSDSNYVPKIVPTVEASQNNVIVYGEPLNAAAHIKGSAVTEDGTTVPGTFSWASDVTSYGNAGSKTLRAIFTPTDANTYDSMIVNVQITVTPADYQVTVPSSQKVTSGVGAFTQPVFTGVNNEAVKGTLNYTYNNQTMNYESLKTALSKLAASTVTVEYSFTATDSNYKNAAKTGTLTFTIEQKSTNVGPSEEPGDNTDDNNSTDTDSGVLEGSGTNTDTGIYGTRLLTANPTTFNTIMLNWDAVDGAKSYEIFYSTSPNSGFKRLANVKKTFYKFSKAKCGVTYYFQMRVCQKGVKSEFGPISYGKTALTDSTTLQVKKTTYNSVTLRWNKVPGAKKYEIFCMDSMGKEWKSLGIKGGTSFTHKKLVTGATYYYQIRPVRDSFYGNYSNGVSSTTILGDISKLKVKAAGVDKMKLTWRKVKGATQYVILRAESIDGTYEVVGHSNKASYTDFGLESGTTYFYKVYAISGPYRTKESSPIGQTTKFPKK